MNPICLKPEKCGSEPGDIAGVGRFGRKEKYATFTGRDDRTSGKGNHLTGKP
jgi:hypothetical protein